MTLRATGNLSGAVDAQKGDDLSKLSAKVKKDLEARGLAKDDGVTEAPAEQPAKPPRKR